MSRRMAEYGGCRLVTGATLDAASRSATVKFETPMWRTLPAFLSSSSVRHASSTEPGIVSGRRRAPARPVNLIEVDRIDAETRQASLDFAAAATPGCRLCVSVA